MVVLNEQGKETRFAQSRFSPQDREWIANRTTWEPFSVSVLALPVDRIRELAAAECPLAVQSLSMTHDAIGTPVVGISVRNQGEQPVIAFKLSIEVFNKLRWPKGWPMDDQVPLPLHQKPGWALSRTSVPMGAGALLRIAKVTGWLWAGA